MKQWIKRGAAALLAVLALGCVPVWADEGSVPVLSLSELTIQGESGVLYEPETDTFLWEKAPEEELAPASVTKIMTMLLTLEAIGQGELAPDTLVVASQNAKEMGGSQINLDTGEEMSVHDLLMAVAVASANDAALALAEEVGGSEAGFVTMMNRRAEELSLTHTHFENPHGLPQEGHYTCAADLARMTAALLENPLAAEYLGCETYTIRAEENPYQMRTTNKLLSTYAGCIGGKTGYTEEAGYCMSVAAAREGTTLIAVAMKEETSEQRQADLKLLLDFGFGHYTVEDFALSPVEAGPVAVENGMAPWVAVEIPAITPPRYLAEKGKEVSLSQTVTLSPSLEAPVEAGDVVGSVSFLVEGEEVENIPLTAAQAVPRRTAGRVFATLWQTFLCC